MIDREKEYDEEIAPQLFKLVQRSADLGMPFFAVVQFKDDDHGRTANICDSAHPIMNAMNILAQCQEGGGVNIDKFTLSLMRGRFTNDSSPVCAVIMTSKAS